ncbi:hypothetical protein MYVALT_F_00300 [Candidatus Vallotia tarda]|uniref:Uncharacterized protein n=1 Tax=Candidatus Vallotiella hemipterorum TaxID=1177213 RepID=A0A916JSB1_9BURK|nr:hypothetical protein MYVALT_F_00300 [Candidatus Vallotia tarda]
MSASPANNNILAVFISVLLILIRPIVKRLKITSYAHGVYIERSVNRHATQGVYCAALTGVKEREMLKP